MKQELPICKGAKEEDVFTTCFQRDSAKDEMVVFIFIFTTVGLLIWAAIKPWVGRWWEVRCAPCQACALTDCDYNSHGGLAHMLRWPKIRTNEIYDEKRELGVLDYFHLDTPWLYNAFTRNSVSSRPAMRKE